MTKCYALQKDVFDINKVTVVGSPTITDDGVASGFSANNYLTKSALNINPLNDWKVSLNIKTPSSQPANYRMVFCIGNENNTANRLYLRNTASNSGLFGVEFIGIKSGSLILQNNFNTNDGFAFDTWYDIEFGQSLNNGVYTTFMRYKPKGESIYQEILDTSATSFSNLSQLIKIGYWNQSTQEGAIGYSVDLTQFKIYVDNELVYSPTKPITYLERRKEGFDLSKFTVVGSPTITEDGVASGFSTGNYLTIPKEIINSLIGHKWKIEYEFKTKPVADGTERYLLGSDFQADETNPIHLGFFNMNYFWFANLLLSDGSKTINFYNVLNNTNFGSMIGYLEFDGNNYTNAVLQETDTSWKISKVASNLSIAEATEDLKIGYRLTSGSIDLKQFSITVDGKEVFTGAKEKYYAMKGNM